MTEAADPEAGIPRAVAIGGVVGMVVCLVGVTAILRIGGQDWGPAIGLGMFVAAWGGLGFGCMLGGVMGFTRMERAEELARLERLQASND